MSNPRIIALALMCWIATACASIPTEQAAKARYVNEQMAAAHAHEEAEELAAALVMLRSLGPLGPDPEVDSEIARLERKIANRVDTSLAAAKKAYARGNNSAGDRYMLKALALQPNQAQALSSLRASNSSKVRAMQTGNKERLAIAATPTPVAEGETYLQELTNLYAGQQFEAMIALEPEVLRTGSPEARNMMREAHIAMAARAQNLNNTSGVLTHLQAAMTAYPIENDPLANQTRSIRANLSSQWFEEGNRLMGRDLDAAVAALQKAIEIDPSNTAAKLKLSQATTLQQNLRKIEAAN